MVVDVGDQLAQRIGNRRVDGDVLGVLSGAGVFALGVDDLAAQDGGLNLAVRPVAADHDLHDFLEIEQPVGQADVVRADHVAGHAEHVGVFVVRIEHDDVPVRVVLQDGAQDQRHRARLAGTCGAEDREMLAE